MSRNPTNNRIWITRQSAEFYRDSALGRVFGSEFIDRPRRSEDIGATFEDFWTVGGTLVYPSSASTLSIVSTSSNDSSSGTGLEH